MMRSLYTAASGMGTQQVNLDNIAHNLSNVGTTGFKRSRLEFQDLMYQNDQLAGSTLGTGQIIPIGAQIGLGVKEAASQRIFAQGVFQQTGNQLDVGIQGDGFFQVTLPDGTFAYTRDGSFKADATNRLVTSDGYIVNPAITLPQGYTAVSIGPDGTVNVFVAGQTAPQQVGQIQLYRFNNNAGLTAAGKNLYTESAASGTATQGIGGQQGFGTLAQGYLEMSNVSVVDEMVNMITAQRAYEINAKVVQGSDHLLGIVAQLKQ